MSSEGKFNSQEELINHLRNMRIPSHICDVFEKVDRGDFVIDKKSAYYNEPSELVQSQTTSQPYIIALSITSADISPTDTVLEIGTGSGYQTAILSYLCDKVHSIEIRSEIFQLANQNLLKYKRDNIILHLGNFMNYSFSTLFDKIIVSACCTRFYDKFTSMTKEKAIIILPIQSVQSQILVKVIKDGTQVTQNSITGCRFVMLEEGNSN
ncbi:MAG: hypothetical protein HY606_10885 [Planctomycetes bacterium]|nr:hypothetical protein [Planctomycetota bacterium]